MFALVPAAVRAWQAAAVWKKSAGRVGLGVLLEIAAR